MCVIVTAEKGSMPTIDQLTRMSETNPDGAGIAWHDGYEAAINDMLNDGIDTTTGIRRR